MTTATSSFIVDTPAGTLRGHARAGSMSFRGVPYARPPVGPLRFEPPEPLPPWDGVLDAIQPPAIAPQAPSRIANVVGDSPAPQSESCLTLDVHTPAADGRARPVIVWLHGGAHATGGGSLAWHDGGTMAREHDVVVVCPNFRLGALGYLYLPGISRGNLGLLDQIAALRWVCRNIRALGGDPDNVTIAGQSSGAACVANLMVMPRAQGLMRRVIIQSAPLGRPERVPQEAAQLGESFLRCAGIDGARGSMLKTLPVGDLLSAQAAYARSLSAPLGATPLPFMPVTDGDELPSVWGEPPSQAASYDVLIGTTREEMAAFHAGDARLAQATEADALASLACLMPQDEAQAAYARYARSRSLPRPATVLGDFFTDRVFRLPSLELARRWSARAGAVYVYHFDWQSPAGLQACHCLDIPFVFDNLPAWRSAPMLAGVDEAEFSGLARKMQAAWAAFARHGNPNHNGVPHWPAFRHDAQYHMRLGDVLQAQPVEPGLAD